MNKWPFDTPLSEALAAAAGYPSSAGDIPPGLHRAFSRASDVCGSQPLEIGSLPSSELKTEKPPGK